MQTMDRRAAAIALGASIFVPTAFLPAKAEMYARHAGLVVMPGVRRIDLGRWPTGLQTYKSVVMTDYIIAPGSGFPSEKIRHDTIYHILEGEVRVRKDKEFTVNAGDIFVCAIGESREVTNSGQIDTVMRVIALKARL